MSIDKSPDLSSILLKDTGLLSKSSVELREFLRNNNIIFVQDLIDCIDNESYKKATYYDTMAEIRGLVDLLKYKYLRVDFCTDMYLLQTIHHIYFDDEILGSPVWLYGVKFLNGKKKNIYSLINRLGFNDKERSIILDVDEESLDGLLVIDLLHRTYDRVFCKENKTSDEIVLCNKLLIILNEYVINNSKDRESNFMKEVEEATMKLQDLLAQRNALELQIKKLQKQLGIEVVEGRSNKK